MNFLLINPYYPISETPSPPLGLSYIASAIRKAGADVKILDYVVFPYDKKSIEKQIQNFKPDAAGITCVSMTFYNALKIIKDIKSIDKDITTIMGGPHITFCAKEVLNKYDCLDIAIIGEGEKTVSELCTVFRKYKNLKHKNLNQIKGIAYKDAKDAVKTEKRAPISDIDDLCEPARDLVPMGRYRALYMPVSITTSRGCPFQCIFCAGSKMGGHKVRYRSPDKAADEIMSISLMNFDQINIADDLFTANAKHAKAICQNLIDRKAHVNWTSFARVDTVSPDLLDKMKEAGCSAVSFGVETGSPLILKTINKKITLDQVEKAVKMCVKAGIIPYASFILGLPGETQDTLKQTIDFTNHLKNLGAGCGFHILAPFPGTEIREKSKEFGINILTDDWSKYDANMAVTETASVKAEQLNKIAAEWKEKYNKWLQRIKDQMEKGNAAKEDAWQIVKLDRIIVIYDLMMKGFFEKEGKISRVGSESERQSGIKKEISGCEINESKEKQIKALAKKAAAFTDKSLDTVIDALSSAFERGSLDVKVKNSEYQWGWKDYI